MSKDYSKEIFQIFFSGVESDKYFEIVTKETNAVLMSYLYIKRKGKTFITNRIKEKPDLRLMIDSGVHTFLAKEDEYSKKPLEYWEKYLNEYVAFARSNKDNVFCIIELDLVDFVGREKILEWREKYFKPLEEEGIQVMYVWHDMEGADGWEYMCKNYKYIGFSLQGERAPDMPTCMRMMNTAKKYGTRVHGLAATGMEYMQKLSFYTVDSTTWLVGTQYGELNYFDGRTMKRLKKDKWKRQFKNKFIQLGADWNLAEREEPYELIRINVLTFIAVEKYLQKIMRNKMYWITATERKEMPERQPIDFKELDIPDREWFFPEEGEADYEGYEDIAMQWGIDINLPKDDITTWLEVFYTFMTVDAEMIEKYSDAEIFSLVDIFGLKNECNTRKKCLEKLPTCFSDHACGKRHEFEKYAEKLASGDAAPKAKEREDYLDEETHIVVDVPKEEVESALKRFLPEGKSDDMPEVDAYDEEIASTTGIIPIRDEKGRIVKGQVLRRKPKQIYSNLMPKLSCDTCVKGTQCPEFKAGFVCAFNKLFKRFDSRNADDVEDAIASMVEHNLQRMQQQMMFEMIDGGMNDAGVTALIDQNIKLLSFMNQMKQTRNQVVATRKVVMDSSGKSVEVVESVSANPQQGGILSKLFGSPTPSKPDINDDEVIEVKAERVE